MFWRKYGKELPKLKSLALILLNIPASSAFIEKFFSQCGEICSRRRGNLSADQIIIRTMLKTNINFLKDLNSSL